MRRGLKFCVFGLSLAIAASASGQAISDENSTGFSKVGVGERQIIRNAEGSQQYAGATLELENFTGLIGRSSDISFIAVIDGEVRGTRKKAGSGHVLIFTPYGGKVVREGFDAAALMASLSEDELDGVVQDALEKLVRKQKRGMFWGLYRPTAFNLTAPGSANAELARRTVVGAQVIQDIRYSNPATPEDAERAIISAFQDALISGDVVAVAALLDPTPYGGTDLRGGAVQAREVVARRLIQSRNWPVELNAAEPKIDPSGAFWRLESGTAKYALDRGSKALSCTCIEVANNLMSILFELVNNRLRCIYLNVIDISNNASVDRIEVIQ